MAFDPIIDLLISGKFPFTATKFGRMQDTAAFAGAFRYLDVQHFMVNQVLYHLHRDPGMIKYFTDYQQVPPGVIKTQTAVTFFQTPACPSDFKRIPKIIPVKIIEDLFQIKMFAHRNVTIDRSSGGHRYIFLEIMAVGAVYLAQHAINALMIDF